MAAWALSSPDPGPEHFPSTTATMQGKQAAVQKKKGKRAKEPTPSDSSEESSSSSSSSSEDEDVAKRSPAPSKLATHVGRCVLSLAAAGVCCPLLWQMCAAPGCSKVSAGAMQGISGMLCMTCSRPRCWHSSQPFGSWHSSQPTARQPSALCQGSCQRCVPSAGCRLRLWVPRARLSLNFRRWRQPYVQACLTKHR